MLKHKRVMSRSVDAELWMLGSKGASAEAFISDEEMNEVDCLTSYACETSKYFNAELLERLGSWELLSAVVSLLYKKLFQHPETRVFFANTDKTKLMKHMAGFLSCALSGHLTLSPYELWSIHRHMLWHPYKSAGPDLDDARDGCPSADYLDGDSTSCPASNSQNGVTVSHCPVTDHPAESFPLPRPQGDVGTGWAEHAHHSASRCPATDYQQARAPESCPMPRPQGEVGTGWADHSCRPATDIQQASAPGSCPLPHQESNSISCPLFTAFQGSAAKDAAAAADAAQDGTAAAAAACGKSVDLPIDAALVREQKAAAQLSAPAYLFCSGTTSKSNDSSKGVESAGLGRPLGSLARGRVSGSSSCSSIGTGPEGGRLSCSPNGTQRGSVLSTGFSSSSSLLNRSSSLSSSASVGMVGLFTRGSSCRDEEDVDNAVGEELAEDEGKSLPVLGPRHVAVMSQLLKDALVELDAKQELIDDMVRVISGASHLFERGDIFIDVHANEAKWQGLGAQEGLRRPFSNDGLRRRSSLKSPESSARLTKPRVSFKSTVGCAEGAAVRPSQVDADPEQERAREKLRNLFASW